MEEKILALRSQGKTYKEIVDELGCAKSTVSYYCGSGQKLKHVVRQRDRRNKVRKYLQQVKTESSCMDCGENYPYWVMQFDHVRGEKTFNISSFSRELPNFTMGIIIEEVAKCDVVCANCHADRTHSRITKHGGDVQDIEEQYIGGMAESGLLRLS